MFQITVLHKPVDFLAHGIGGPQRLKGTEQEQRGKQKPKFHGRRDISTNLIEDGLGMQILPTKKITDESMGKCGTTLLRHLNLGNLPNEVIMTHATGLYGNNNRDISAQNFTIIRTKATTKINSNHS
jgi:hypothetical protein